MKSIVAAIAALAVAVVSAQENIVSVTAPLQGAVYHAGSDAIISWINPTVDTISQIVLSNGPSTALQPVMTIAENVDANAGSYTWSVPSDITPGTDYALQFGTSPNVSYAGPFSIEAGSGSSNSSAPASSSGAAATSSAPASSSAAASSTPARSSSAASSSSPSSSASGDAAEESTGESAAVKSQPAALAALAIAGVAAVAMV